MEENTSSPPNSAVSKGPVSARRLPMLDFTASSTSSMDAMPDSTICSASLSRANWRRLEMNPFASFRRTAGLFPKERRNLLAASTVSGRVFSPGQTSTRGMRCAGFQKWVTTNLSGFLSGEAIAEGSSPEVLLPMIPSFLQYFFSFQKDGVFCLHVFGTDSRIKSAEQTASSRSVVDGHGQ